MSAESSEPDPVAVQAISAGSQLYTQGKLEEALLELTKAAELAPESFEAQYNRGVVQRDLERLDEAEASFLKARDLDPQRSAEVDNNLGVLCSRRGQLEASIEHYRRAIEREFQFAQAHLNLSFSLLKLGHYEEGWKEHEWRWQTDGFHPIRCLQPRWNGQRLEGTVLVHSEQGAGDTFQFARFLPQVRQRCDQVILVIPERLRCVFQGDQWADEIIHPGSLPLDRFQAILPLMSAPYALGAGGDTLSSTIPYLIPEQRSVDLGPVHVADAKLKVGIVWGGSPTHANDRHRSFRLEQVLPIFEVPQVAFYSLQKGPQVSDIEQFGKRNLRDTDELQQDFADTGSIMQQLDLILSVDTSVLHLAGALGLPAWGLLCDRSDWRWLIEGEKTDWYPTMRLYRQKELGDWTELAERVAKDLHGVVSGTVELARAL